MSCYLFTIACIAAIWMQSDKRGLIAFPIVWLCESIPSNIHRMMLFLVHKYHGQRPSEAYKINIVEKLMSDWVVYCYIYVVQHTTCPLYYTLCHSFLHFMN